MARLASHLDSLFRVRGITNQPVRRITLAAIAVASLLVAVGAAAVAVGGQTESLRGVDRAKPAGLGMKAPTWSAEVFDYDADGWDDVLIVRHRFQSARLYRNVRGKFRLVHGTGFWARRGSGTDRHDCAWADVDHNGLNDLFCTEGGGHGHGAAKINELWMQGPKGDFTDRGDAMGVADPYGRGRFATFIDVDRDGWRDLYIGNTFPRTDGFASPNVLFMNEQGTGFRRAPEFGLEQEVGGMSVQAVDFDRDGWRDLVVCGNAGVSMFRNVKGARFTDVTERRGASQGCVFSQMRDLNRDGRLDLVTLRKHQLDVRLARGRSLAESAFKRSVTNGRSLAIGDFNGDFWPDLYVLNGSELRNNPDLLLLSRKQAHSFERLRSVSTNAGTADQVVALDSDRDGRSEFLALNGRGESRGPIQLITPKRDR